MKFAVSPSYTNIFKKKPPPIESFTGDIPSKVIIAFLSGVNALLFLEDNGVHTQRKIFQIWVKRFTEIQKNEIWEGIYPFISRKENPPSLFAHWYLLEFIQHELLNHREFDIEDTTPDQEYKMFQAYMIIVEMLNDQHKDIFSGIGSEKDDKFRVQKIIWPMLSRQYDFNYTVDPAFQFIKSLVWFGYLSRDGKISKYVKSFLSVVNQKKFSQYVMGLVELARKSLNENQESLFRPFCLIPTEEYVEIIKAMTISPEGVKSNKRLQMDYLGIREKPFYSLGENRYVNMNWNFFYNQLHLGLQFDFYKRSGIKEIFTEFPDFKSYTSKNISEGLIFTGIMKSLLTTRYSVTEFDDGSEPGFPDCYHREGKYIFLIEFKDVLMSAKVSYSADYSKIREDIDAKFIENKGGDKKGIRQLIEHIKKINEGGFTLDRFEEKGCKRKNLVIYPVIVYTHFMYSMPGVNNYLNTRFREEVENEKKKNEISVRLIKDLVMVDFQFFYMHFSAFIRRKTSIKKILDLYYDEMRRRRKKAKRTGNSNDILLAQSSFETVSFNLPIGFLQGRDKNAVNELFKALKINEELFT